MFAFKLNSSTEWIWTEHIPNNMVILVDHFAIYKKKLCANKRNSKHNLSIYGQQQKCVNQIIMTSRSINNIIQINRFASKFFSRTFRWRDWTTSPDRSRIFDSRRATALPPPVVADEYGRMMTMMCPIVSSDEVCPLRSKRHWLCKRWSPEQPSEIVDRLIAEHSINCHCYPFAVDLSMANYSRLIRRHCLHASIRWDSDRVSCRRCRPMLCFDCSWCCRLTRSYCRASGTRSFECFSRLRMLCARLRISMGQATDPNHQNYYSN